jgi:hypothetical protein
VIGVNDCRCSEFTVAVRPIVLTTRDTSPRARTPQALLKLLPIMSKTCPSVPDALAIRDVMDQSAALGLLKRRIDESMRRLACVRCCLPESLTAHVAAGPIDDTGWTLLATNSNVAAKLRHLQPAIEARLAYQGFSIVPLRIKTRSD